MKMNSERLPRYSVTDDHLYPSQYALTGEQSTRNSTVNVRISALYQLNVYIRKRDINATPFKERDSETDATLYHTTELENIFCSKKFWMQYATFLVDFATKQKKGDAFSPGTAYNYIGIAKERIRLIYPDNQIWIGHEWLKGNNSSSNGWFTKIRDQVRSILTTRRQESGLLVEEEYLPIGTCILTLLLLVIIHIYLSYMYIIGRVVLADCIKYLLGLNTRIGVEKSIALAITLSTIGRAGEAGWVVYEHGYWDYTNDVLYLMWNDIKTKRQLLMNFHHDYSDYRLCIYFLMFLYFLVGAGQSYTGATSYTVEKKKRKLQDSTLIFPFLISGAAGKISDYLHSCVNKVKNLRPGRMKVTARGLRYGGLQETAVREREGAGIYRGGWSDNANENANRNANIYMRGCDRLLIIASKTISDFPNPEGRVFPPSCEAFLSNFNQADRQKFQNFLATIMKGSYDIVSDESPLQPFAYAMFASFLRWMPEFSRTYGYDHCTMQLLKKSMATFHYTWDDFDRWSQAVLADFNLKNALMVPDGSAVPGWAAQLLQSHISLEESIRKLTRENEELKSSIHKTNLLLQDGANNNICSANHSSPLKKRSMEPLVSQDEPESNKCSRLVEEPTIDKLGNYNAFEELMNRRKQPSGESSMLISSSTDVIDRQFITNLYDYDMKYKLPILVSKQKKSKIVIVMNKCIVPTMKLVSLVTSWPSKQLQPMKSDIQWNTWESNRSKIADDVVKKIHDTFKDKVKTKFNPTFSAIYNKLTPVPTSKENRK